ncbi:hypothetical protein FRC11_010671 [Ceratobasidium sp. 423]|nr:hypothetical protein FRC11_010671 [Ceratobasidium sp. 423]
MAHPELFDYSEQVHELGSLKYNELIPPEERIVGSRAAIVVEVHQSCGFSVPLYEAAGERTTLQELSAPLEEADQQFAKEREGFEATSPLSHFEFMPSTSDPPKNDHSSKGTKDYWPKWNVRSVDGLPALRFCRELGGLPPEAIKEDRKLFHEGIVDVKIVNRLEDKAHQITEMIGGAWFIIGFIMGVLLSLNWMRLHGGA